jgi:hypothetical protein
MAPCSPAAFVGALAVGLCACGDTAPRSTGNNPFDQLTAAVDQMQKAAEGLTAAADRKPVPPVAFRELIGFLPRSVGGMKAEEPKGETTTAGSWQYSQAEIDFRSPDQKRSAEVGIFDYAHIPFLYVPIRMVLNMKVSRESTDGYERSGQVAGFPAYEKWNKDKSSEVVVLVGDRFVVKTGTRGVGEGSARKIAERMDLKGLAAKGTN